jgi:two-component system nitrogen regulation response regulator GlnG
VHADVRLIAATDQDVYAPAFNQPLLRRLEGFLVRLPPLRARREDIGALIAHFLDGNDVARTAGLQLPYEFVSACANYAWPGNIRQLAHVMARAVLALAHGQVPLLHELADMPRSSSSASAEPAREAAAEVPAAAQHQRKRLADVSEQDALDAMENNGWYIQAAAQQLGISRPSMYKLIEANSQIRRAEQIAPDDILQAYRASGGALEKCASLLKTPSEALRRRLGALGLSAHNQT